MPDSKDGRAVPQGPAPRLEQDPAPRRPWQIIGRPLRGPRLLLVEEVSSYSFRSRTGVQWAEVRPQPPTICPCPALGLTS